MRFQVWFGSMEGTWWSSWINLRMNASRLSWKVLGNWKLGTSVKFGHSIWGEAWRNHALRGNDRCSSEVTPSDASGRVKDGRWPTLLAQISTWGITSYGCFIHYTVRVSWRFRGKSKQQYSAVRWTKLFHHSVGNAGWGPGLIQRGNPKNGKPFPSLRRFYGLNNPRHHFSG